MPLSLITLTPGELGAQYCFTNWQRLNVDIVSRIGAVLNNNQATYWNIGAETPSANNRPYPWLNTADGNVYFWNGMFGMWTSPYPTPPGNNGLIQMWDGPVDGTGSGLWTFDGGDGSDPNVAGKVSEVTGSFWTVKTTMATRFPIGAGTLPVTTTVLPIGGTGGVEQVTIDKTQMPYHGHNMPTTDDTNLPGVDVAVFGEVGTAWRAPSDSKDQGFGRFLYEGGDLVNHVTQPFTVIPPYYALSFITRTARQWRAIPG